MNKISVDVVSVINQWSFFEIMFFFFSRANISGLTATQPARNRGIKLNAALFLLLMVITIRMDEK